MSSRIPLVKLCDGDFDFIHWEKDSGQEKESFELMIYGKSKSHCMQIKQQILDNQEFISKYHKELKELQKTSNNSLSVEDCDKMIKQQKKTKIT